MSSASRTAAPAAVLLCVLIALLSGCATPQTSALLNARPATLPAHVELVSVPFFPQEAYQCGPAALATALTYAGERVTPDALTDEVYLPARKGSLAPEMLAAARRHGFIAYPLAPRLADVLTEVAHGTPVVVLQNLSLPIWPMWHYAVVIGYDLPRDRIILRSGTTRRLTMTLGTFEHTWARSHDWAMVVLTPDRLPATAEEDTYVTAAAALERENRAAAHRAYRTALRRWPRNLVARIGLGNTAYAMHHLVAAEAAYRRATIDHPNSADAWNNLAQTLADRGRHRAALKAAQRAVAIGGSRRATYEATLRGISEQR